ncbi:MAG: site-2 protease family protein [Phycisphaerales bacterium]
MNPDLILLGAAWYAIFVISTTCHEAAHAFTAYRLGDPTAHAGGQVSLLPTAHIKREPIGMVFIPIISYFLNGWMIGWASTPYNPDWARAYPKREIMMALAGPAANLILVLIAASLIRLGLALGFFIPPESTTFSHITEATTGGFANALAILVSIMFMLNLVLFVFNLMPLPPLDGSSILPLILDERTAAMYKNFMSTPGIALVGLIIAWQVFGFIFGPIHTLALNLLYPGLHYS